MRAGQPWPDDTMDDTIRGWISNEARREKEFLTRFIMKDVTDRICPFARRLTGQPCPVCPGRPRTSSTR
jgi:hypothetical protein